MEPSRIVIAGGTGLLGRLVKNHFADQGREVVVLSRSDSDGTTKWDGATQGFWSQSLEGASAVINFCGVPVTSRWTEKNKKLYLDSRVVPTEAIGEAVRKAQTPPKVWINASAVGFYGDTEKECSEATRAGGNFFGKLCSQWEHACLRHDTPGTRKVCLRIGVVLDQGAEFVRATSMLTKIGLGAPQGSGRQYLSWIHSHDFVRMVEWCLFEPVSGPLNAVSPHPVTNAEYMESLRHIYGRLKLPAVPEPLIKLVVGLIGKEPSLLLTGQRVVPEIARARGFTFRFPELEPALVDVLQTVPEAWKTA